MSVDAEIFTFTMESLKDRKWRSYLTLLGIVIGIAAIVAFISIGQSLNNAVEAQFEQMGSNTIMVLAGKNIIQSAFAELDPDDPALIENIKGVESVAAIYFELKTAEYKGEAKSVIIAGIDPDDFPGLRDAGLMQIGEGRELTNSDLHSIMVGGDFVERAFVKELGLRNKINIEDNEYRIVGITEPAGHSFGSFYDSAIIVGEKTLKLITGGEDLVPYRIIAKTVDADDVPDIKAEIWETLEDAHGEEDFQVMTPAQIGEGALGILGLIQLVVAGIAAIALVVGGIGIMNTMLMTVIERTREIGTMKAIGATSGKIMRLFVFEAGLIGLAGGVIGMFFGFFISFLISVVADVSGFPLPFAFDPVLAAGTLLFAVGVGMVSGVYPARRAAKMDPVDALRYE